MAMPKQIIVIGRGHSGTRAIAGVLYNSGFKTGKLNPYNDLIPAQPMYDAVNIASKRVKRTGEYEWDFSMLVSSKPTLAFQQCVNQYLDQLTGLDPIAWKLPETTLALPWIVKMFPDAYYIHWVRDGRDNILQWHGSEEFDKFGIPADYDDDDRMKNGAVSWKYHEDIIEATPKPLRWTTVRLRDFVYDHAATMRRLSDFVGHALPTTEVYTDVIGRWQSRQDEIAPYMPILEKHLVRHGFV